MAVKTFFLLMTYFMHIYIDNIERMGPVFQCWFLLVFSATIFAHDKTLSGICKLMRTYIYKMLFAQNFFVWSFIVREMFVFTHLHAMVVKQLKYLCNVKLILIQKQNSLLPLEKSLTSISLFLLESIICLLSMSMSTRNTAKLDNHSLTHSKICYYKNFRPNSKRTFLHHSLENKQQKRRRRGKSRKACRKQITPPPSNKHILILYISSWHIHKKQKFDKHFHTQWYRSWD